MLVELLFVAFAGLLLWHYVGYPLALWGVTRLVGERPAPEEPTQLPPITIVVIAHNEGDVIEERVRNCLASYPTEKLEVIVASDASTDDTVARAREVSPRVRAFDNTPHNKSETRNMAVERARTDIVLFTDADTRYESGCVRELVTHLSDPGVGHVCGTLESESFEEGPIGEGMNLYWRWEYWLRRLQSHFGLLVKSTGANMGMRREYFSPVPGDADVDQVAGFDAILAGGESRYVPEAVAAEQFPTEIDEEFATRKRLTVRGLTALWRYRTALNPVRCPALAVHTASYWLLRYLQPFVLLGVFATTGVLAVESLPAAGFLALQLLFYALAVAGYLTERRGLSSPVTGVPFSYCWANVGVLTGAVAFLTGTRIYAYDADK